MEPRIYLQAKPGASISPTAIVHEAAHARHLTLGEGFSRQWRASFRIARGESWKDRWIVPCNGLVGQYSAFDYSIDDVPALHPEPDGPPQAVFCFQDHEQSVFEESEHYGCISRRQVVLSGQYKVMVFDSGPYLNNSYQYSAIAEEAIYLVAWMPDTLREYVRELRVDPHLNAPGMMFGNWEGDSLYPRLCEDVATSTAAFWKASVLPGGKSEMLARFRRSAPMQGRLEMLVKHGFLGPDVLDRVHRAAWG